MRFEDNFRHKGLRKKLVEELRQKGIKDERVLDAIGRIPRHLFMDSSFLEFAYIDKAFPIGSGQTISQPFTVAFQTELLEVEKGHKVLEVGTGSGYQACVLVEMGAKVYSIERQKALYQRTKKLLPEIGYKIKHLAFGDGYKGLQAWAPFDRIIVTAGATILPQTLIEQLKPGGIMVIPLGKNVQTMKKIEKSETGEILEKDYGSFRFVPLLEDRAND